MQERLQKELHLLGEITNELRELDAKLVARCESMPRAYRLCMDTARVQRSQEDWAESIGLKPSHFKQMLKTNAKLPKYMPPEAESRLEVLAGNKAPTQWRRLQQMGMLDCQRSIADEEAALLTRLAEIRGQRGSTT